MPCHPARARQLLKQGRAVIHRVAPFVIRLKDREEGDTQPVRLKLDPGSKFTGVALVREQPSGGIAILSLLELRHRGRQISDLVKRIVRVSVETARIVKALPDLELAERA